MNGGIMDRIGLIHGEGGKHTQELIKELFYKEFFNETLIKDKDSAILAVTSNKMAFTTDSFVVNPIFFSGGDIGRLCISGTVNDLVTSFAVPKFISLSFIIEEGFPVEKLKKILTSIKESAEEAEVIIATGDTKVVERGNAQGIFINTSGIGFVEYELNDNIGPGDKVILTSTIGEHGTAIAVERYGFQVVGDIKSDVKPLNNLIEVLWEYKEDIRLLKDPTRGGIGQCFNEISSKYKIGLNIDEWNIPIRSEVRTINEIIGLDPYYLASEGAMILIVKEKSASKMVDKLRKCEGYKKSSIVGEITIDHEKVILKNNFGGKRILQELDSVMLPRIC